jgi:hypothetical protein
VTRLPITILLAVLPASLAAQDPWQPLHAPPQQFVGTLSCSSTSCHGRTEPFHSGRIQRQEYLHFLQSDPHALAGRRLTEPRYLEVLRAATEHDSKAASRCVNCHDPLGAAGELARQPLGRGIGCESCHGSAGGWLDKHYQHGVSREQLTALGFIDTKQVLARARVCAECHVGSASRDVNHDLLAAGHPPLQFELASHQALLTRKHWNDSPRRLREPDYDVQLWAAGRIASADAALTLLTERATRAHQGAPWPEFAESNCRSCHRSLLAEPSSSRGILPWQRWNVALQRPLPELAALRGEMERSLIPSTDRVAELAAQARAALRQQVRLSPNGQLLARSGSSLTAAEALEQLADHPAAANWEEA